jgi:hypothetical protein
MRRHRGRDDDDLVEGARSWGRGQTSSGRTSADTLAHDRFPTCRRASARIRAVPYHWHKHDVEDECFVVLDGELELDIEGRALRSGGTNLTCR